MLISSGQGKVMLCNDLGVYQHSSRLYTKKVMTFVRIVHFM